MVCVTVYSWSVPVLFRYLCMYHKKSLCHSHVCSRHFGISDLKNPTLARLLYSQIIEREMHLPVDLVLSPSTCLFVYTLEKLNVDKAIFSHRPVEVLSAAVEVIIDDHMRASSVAYHRCVMVRYGKGSLRKRLSANKLLLESCHSVSYRIFRGSVRL